MAERSIFIPSEVAPGLVQELGLHFSWHGGFSAAQKKRNVIALHQAAALKGFQHLLEVSTKSEEKLGQRLSAFNLKVQLETCGEIALECAYQGSKVFEEGGPYTDLYETDGKSARQDLRLKNSGQLRGFRFGNLEFPLQPTTAFYNWLYIRSIFPHRDWLRRLIAYSGFTDIEFNPGKSINCQARSCALFVSMMRLDLLKEDILMPDKFVDFVKHSQVSKAFLTHSRGDQIHRSVLLEKDDQVREDHSEKEEIPISDERQLEMGLL